ncbi:BMP family ABC transporter substrate-binding protein [Thiospirochaeta perfilievii]|uniref:BMP family ABC transporter substrate-binding protein n=1 Tax=Thiospirochaeta perfilievii TaxID=252967 RepID=A0A5C1QEY9_9SPIO|nr:BMP family ABC transporter substrate-binding protein [Thiospirochaeta perfilievii]QEN05254.1 BMP family ABC transporter substrate-binding protein [Thiospirochaeta perfilievii]
MKKIGLLLLMMVIFAASTFANSNSEVSKESTFKIGMVTDSGSIDDKSFNQGTWEGIVRAGDELGTQIKYLKPVGTTEADYLKEVGNLYDAGYKFIVTPGFKFETTIYKAQEKYSDAKFVLIDGIPHPGDYNSLVKLNTVSIFFAEQEAGFLAGIATALKLSTGSVGFIGGMEIPPVQKFNWGFQQGIAYANDNLSTDIALDAENIIYQGTFDNVAAGQQLAAQMFDKGVNAIFCAAGGVGVGAINEAKNRVKAGEKFWIVGVDVDQYSEGIYEENKSVILTSAMKKIDNAAFDMIQAELNGTFPGAQVLTFNAANNGVGIPEVNPNLTPAIESTVNDVFKKLQNGEFIVSDEKGDLYK